MSETALAIALAMVLVVRDKHLARMSNFHSHLLAQDICVVARQRFQCSSKAGANLHQDTVLTKRSMMRLHRQSENDRRCPTHRHRQCYRSKELQRCSLRTKRHKNHPGLCSKNRFLTAHRLGVPRCTEGLLLCMRHHTIDGTPIASTPQVYWDSR